MSTVELRADLHELIDQLDEPFLKAVHAMVSVYHENADDPILGYDIDGTPRTASELSAILDKRIERIKEGNYVTFEEYKKQSAEWGKDTK
ncbi:MAG: hypothetical protein AAF798_08130 [Bacteroidota bacterium]